MVEASLLSSGGVHASGGTSAIKIRNKSERRKGELVGDRNETG